MADIVLVGFSEPWQPNAPIFDATPQEESLTYDVVGVETFIPAPAPGMGFGPSTVDGAAAAGRRRILWWG